MKNPTARIIVPAGADRELWLAERGEGVTASNAWRIARAGLKARRTIAEEKMNGSRFRGTAATRAGSAREAALLDEAAERLQSVVANDALWAAADNDLHRATPDGFGWDGDGRLAVVEVKSHEHGWEHDGIPIEHYAQLQFQIRVMGADFGLYGFEVRDEDDQPPTDGATWIVVERDEEMIAWLTERADDFIAWRDAGCPDVDDLPDEVAAALEEWVPRKLVLTVAVDAEKTANAALKKAIAKLPHAARFGAVGMGKSGGFQLSVSESVAIDEAAWAAADPDGHARAEQLRVDLAFAEAAAKRKHPKTTRRTTLNFQEA
ncbi:hypothetical protein [Microbacterium oleivorans]|uniref:YqaJ viral recombinase domain-containing protein n=1 Tax=Microbacterium oleivorans TaxID=273677 RepID=A0A7D5IPL4_9MICO|nr:hypothetical protein [Microbacterium oleivorans]QLD10921.1 hypothetical protein HW566_03440 [Microbacterium oleivorans]